MDAITRFSAFSVLCLGLAILGNAATLQRAAALDFMDAIAVAVDPSGSIFFIEGDRIRRIEPDGQVSTLAGSGFPGFRGDGGPAVSAEFDEPMGLAFDASGNLFIADRRNNCVRKIAPDGTITTVAGTGIAEFSGDGGQAIAAGVAHPVGVAVDRAGNLFVGEGSRIRKISPSGVISTIAGIGVYGMSGDGGPATLARISANTGRAEHGRLRKP